jgi:uncharacterized protein (TIGR00725 family)
VRRAIIGVVGGGSRHVANDSPVYLQAFEVGSAIARAGGVVLCGGGGGVMSAAAIGARLAGGHSIGVLPHSGPTDAEFAVETGMGDGRNYVNAYVSDAIIALFGEAGTLSEIALAMKLGRPVVYLGHWSFLNDAGLPRMPVAASPADAVGLAFGALGVPPGGRVTGAVKLPTIPDLTSDLSRLAAWVDALP